jgi:spermidine/putrescine transport system permease protein
MARPNTPNPRNTPPGARLRLLLRRHLIAICGWLALGYLLLPNLVVLLFSFNKPKGRYNYTWRRASLDAWQDPCGVSDICSTVGLSLKIAVLATLGATVLGTLAAFALGRHRFRGRSTANVLVFLPMAMPEVVLAASLGTLFLNMRIPFGFWTILIAHIMFCLSFVIVAVKARVAGLDPALEQAARDLYATGWQAFRKVTLPLAAPGIAAGALLSFALSVDDFVITQFNSGNSLTFPMYVWGAAQKGTPVQINVIGTGLFVIAVVTVVLAQLLGTGRAHRRDRAATALPREAS